MSACKETIVCDLVMQSQNISAYEETPVCDLVMQSQNISAYKEMIAWKVAHVDIYLPK